MTVINVTIDGDSRFSQEILDQTRAAAQKAEDALHGIDARILDMEERRPPISIMSSGVTLGQNARSIDFSGSGFLVTKGGEDDYTISIAGGGSTGGGVGAFTVEMNGTSSQYIAYHNLGRLVITARVITPGGDIAEVGVSNHDEHGNLSLNVSRVFSSIPMMGTLTLL